jgi:hypothetical protein
MALSRRRVALPICSFGSSTMSRRRSNQCGDRRLPRGGCVSGGHRAGRGRCRTIRRGVPVRQVLETRMELSRAPASLLCPRSGNTGPLGGRSVGRNVHGCDATLAAEPDDESTRHALRRFAIYCAPRPKLEHGWVPHSRFHGARNVRVLDRASVGVVSQDRRRDRRSRRHEDADCSGRQSFGDA